MRFIVLGLILVVAGCQDAAPTPSSVERSSEVVRLADAGADQQDWGVFYPHFTGETPATRDMLTGVADIKPGQLIHPPHRHAEEEFLMVISGEGTWSLKGKEFPAAAGDILYAAPWDIHGIENTGAETLRFVVFKYNPQGVAVPVDPHPERGEFGE